MDAGQWLTLAAVVVPSIGAIATAVWSRRKIQADAKSVAADTDRIQDERTRSAFQDARIAEGRARKWSDAFYRLWHWVQVHFAMHHHSDGVELPDRDMFSPDDTGEQPKI